VGLGGDKIAGSIEHYSYLAAVFTSMNEVTGRGADVGQFQGTNA
jgi:hypothetical protein